MGIEDRNQLTNPAQRRANPEDPFGTGIEANGKAGIELTLTKDSILFRVVQAVKTRTATPKEAKRDKDTCTLILPVRWPGRPLDETSISIPGVPIVEGNYDGFKIALEAAGFSEYKEQGFTTRTPLNEDGKRDVILTPGDFKKRAVASSRRLRNGIITFPHSPTAEEHLMNSVVGWGNYMVLSEKGNKAARKLTLVDLDINLCKILEHYPLERLVQNPLSPYLPTRIS